MSTVKTEQILVVPTQLFRSLGYFQGFSAEIDRYLPDLLDGPQAVYRPRAEMETDPDFKQLIPYVIFRYTSADGEVSLFCYTRGSGQGEARLHNKMSLGVGGHISRDDCDSSSAYRAGMQRELDEEVAIDCQFTERCIGLINDDSNEVGQVHLGVVHVLDVTQPRVTAREAELEDGEFLTLKQLRKLRDRLETWSQICLDHLLSGH